MQIIEPQQADPLARIERRPRVGKGVTAAIAEDICAGRYPAGTPLPRENDLCSLHGVSRTVIRESLKTLESKGLVRGKPRIGTMVCDRDDWNILDQDLLEWMGPHINDFAVLDCIIEARRTIEPAAAEYAAARASVQEIADLDAAWQRMRAAGDDPERFTQADVAFHTLLLNASHNQVFRRLSSAIHAALRYTLHASNIAAESRDEAIVAHGALVEALRMRDAGGARRCANRLLDLAVRDLAGGRFTASPPRNRPRIS